MPTLDGAPKRPERIRDLTAVERAKRSFGNVLVAIIAGYGGGLAIGHVAGKTAEHYFVPKTSDAELKKLYEELNKLTERKRGKGPLQLFGDWAKDVGKDAKGWLTDRNEPAIKAKIQFAEASKTVRGALEWIVYVIAFYAAFKETGHRLRKLFGNLLAGRANYKRQAEVTLLLNEYNERIKELEESSKLFLEILKKADDGGGLDEPVDTEQIKKSSEILIRAATLQERLKKLEKDERKK